MISLPSFLEFVMEKLHGPSDTGGTGWCCPFHPDEHPSFSIGLRETGYWKFRCFACGIWGDEFDLIKRAYPQEDYGHRKSRLEIMLREYVEIFGSAPPYPLPGGMKGIGTKPSDPESVRWAWEIL